MYENKESLVNFFHFTGVHRSSHMEQKCQHLTKKFASKYNKSIKELFSEYKSCIFFDLMNDPIVMITMS